MSKEIPVIWAQHGGCTGCSVSFLNAARPAVKNILIDEVVPGTHIELRFHLTVMAGQGEPALEVVRDTVRREKGGYVLIVEGSIDPEYGRSLGVPLDDVARDALAAIAVGNCAAFGGLPAGRPNPVGYMGVGEAFGRLGIRKPLINVPGCPMHPDWLSGTIVGILLKGLPGPGDLDDLLRPKAFYGKLIHDRCQRRADFDAGKFAARPGDDGCLYELGCKGPFTSADCPERRWNNRRNWCVENGYPCQGCVEPEFADLHSPYWKKIPLEAK